MYVVLYTCGNKHHFSLRLLSYSALPFDRIGVRMQTGPINNSPVAFRPITDIVYAMILIEALTLTGGSNDGEMVTSSLALGSQTTSL